MFGKIKIDRADRLFSLYIRHRDNWTCQRCSKKFAVGDQYLQNSHYYGRGRESTRFEPDNCKALCAGCHSFFTSNPGEYTAWMVIRLGQKRYDTLALQANTYQKKDRKLAALYYSQKLKTMGVKP